MRINRSLITNFDQDIDAGNIVFNYTSKTSNTTITDTTGLNIYLINAFGGSITITLPTAANNGAYFIFKKTDASGNAVVIDPYSTETIDNASTLTLYDQYNYVGIISNGVNWVVVDEFRNEIWT